MPAKTSEPDRPAVFLSYSHKDERWLEDFRTMLAPLVRSGIVDVWWDGEIKPSQKWREEIDNALSSARIGLLLVSPNFLASDFIAQEELPYLLEAAAKRGVTLFWVLLSPALYKYSPLRDIQAAHDTSRPLSTLEKPKRDTVLQEICEKIAEEEAVQPMQAGLEAGLRVEDWKEAAIRAGNLSELTLTLGEVERAVAFGRQSVNLADHSGDAFQKLSKRTTLADALRQAGRWEESAEAFREAEARQAEFQPHYPRLYSLQGHRYCDLLLSRGEPEDGSGPDGLAAASEARRFREACLEVRGREEALEVAKENNLSHLTIALDHLSLGRSHLGLALTAAPGEETEPGFAQAVEHLDRAVEGLRGAGTEHRLPWGLLARSTLRRLRNDLPGAEADLSEALEIAERGLMRLFECDAHLEWARLCRRRGDGAEAKQHVAEARRLVNETGYLRREREVRWLEGQV